MMNPLSNPFSNAENYEEKMISEIMEELDLWFVNPLKYFDTKINGKIK